MTGLFGGGKTTKPTPAPPAPNRSNEDLQAEAERERQRFYGSQGGRAMTMFTSGSGVTEPVSSAVVKLLGDVGR